MADPLQPSLPAEDLYSAASHGNAVLLRSMRQVLGNHLWVVNSGV
jgi:hypothetical protein